MYSLIAPFFKTFDDTGLYYIVPDFLMENIEVGQIVEIPFKEKIEYGVIVKLTNEIDLHIDEKKIKSIINIHNINIFLSNYRVFLLTWLAKYNFTPLHNSISLFFPKNLVGKIKNGKIDLEKNISKKYSFNYKLQLSESQKKAFNQILESKNNKILFYGLTGSGKTEIYIKLIKYYLDKQKQSLLLIPEIVLTNQISQKIINVFGEDVIILNSTVTDATKTKNRIDINSGNAKVIIGTRSALFYPYNNLGIIIVDEEHDNSYISDQAPRYNSLDVVNKITSLNGNKLILASGTPSITSMYKATKGKYNLINLLNKYKST